MYTDDEQFGQPRATHTKQSEGRSFIGQDSMVQAERDVHKLTLNRGAEFTIKNPYKLSGRGKAGEVAKILKTTKPILKKMSEE